MAKWGLENMSGFFVVRSIRSHISIASIICDYFVRNFRVSYCFRNKFRATQKSKWLNLSGIRRQRPDSNLVFRIRYGEHNNIIVLITGRAVRRALFTFQIGLFFLRTLSRTMMIYYQIFVQANYGLFFGNATNEWCFLALAGLPR